MGPNFERNSFRVQFRIEVQILNREDCKEFEAPKIGTPWNLRKRFMQSAKLPNLADSVECSEARETVDLGWYM